MNTFARKVHSLERKHGSDAVYGLLCRLAGTVSKQYDSEEQIEALIEECEMFEKDPDCFTR